MSLPRDSLPQRPDPHDTDVSDQELQFALARFDGEEEAAAARFAAASERWRGAPWLREVGAIEHHRNGRLVLGGMFAGRYVYADETDHASDRGARRGAEAVGPGSDAVTRGTLGAAERADLDTALASARSASPAPAASAES